MAITLSPADLDIVDALTQSWVTTGSAALSSSVQTAWCYGNVGSRHYTAIAEVNGELVLARWPRIKQHNRGFDREISQHMIAAAHGLSPSILASDRNNQALLMPYLKPSVISWRDATTALRAVHALPQSAPRLNIAHAMNYWFDRAPKQPWETQQQHNLAHWAEVLFATHQHDAVFSHGDYSVSNVLRNTRGQCVVIDWEYACVAPRWWDLAILCQTEQLPTEKRRSLLAQYWRRSPSAQELETLSAFIDVYTQLLALWTAATATGNTVYDAITLTEQPIIAGR